LEIVPLENIAEDEEGHFVFQISTGGHGFVASEGGVEIRNGTHTFDNRR
jgi:hypothetical protein